MYPGNAVSGSTRLMLVAGFAEERVSKKSVVVSLKMATIYHSIIVVALYATVWKI